MKRIVRLTESNLARIVRRVINENKNNILQCVATAAGLDYNALINLSPCANLLTGTPTTEKISACFEAAKGLTNEKTKNMDYFEKLKYLGNITIESAKCIGKDFGDSMGGGDSMEVGDSFGPEKRMGMIDSSIKESRRRRYLREDEMNLSSVSKLSEIEGIDSIPECSTDNENFNSALCLSKAMDTLSFNTFVKEFFPTFQEIANVTKTPLQTTPMDLPSVAESRRRRYGRY